MGLLRKLKKLTNFRFNEDSPRPPPRLPKARHRSAPESDLHYDPLPNSFFHAVNSAREQSGYDPLPIFPQGSPRMARDQHFHRAKSLDRSRRQDSAEHLDNPLPGTPIKFRRRPVSPELLRARASSASSLFHAHAVPSSPDAMRRFQPVPQFDAFAQQELFMAHSVPYFPQFQQPAYPMFYPHAQGPNWFMPPAGHPHPVAMHRFF